MNRWIDRRLVVALALLASTCIPEADGEPARNWEVAGGTVSVGPAVGVRFDVAEVELANPLPRPAVTARVTTVEMLTSPSHAPLAGRVVESRVRIGDRVGKGDKLVRIQAADLPAIERELQAAKLTVRTKEATLQKLAQMVESRLAAEHDLVLAKSELDEAQLTVKAARGKLKSLAVSRSGDTSYWVLASRSGTVVQLDAAPGQQVVPDHGSPVATVADLDEVLVVADVPQREAHGLMAGMRALIHVPGSMLDPVPGTIELVSDVVDADRQTVPVRIRASNEERHLRPNAYVDVTFVPGESKAIVVVPASAVVRDGADSLVFIATSEGVFQARHVEIGHRDREAVEIVRGLQSGERIVVTNALLLLNAIAVEA